MISGVKRWWGQSSADVISLSASVVCMVHCVALPLVLAIVPLWSADALESVWLEVGTLLLSLVAGGFAIINGYRKGRLAGYWVWVFMVSLITMALANYIQHGEYEMSLKFAGAIGVIAAHITNIRHRKHTCANP